MPGSKLGQGAATPRHRTRARDEILDVGACGSGGEGIDPATGARRQHEAHGRFLHERLDAQRGVHLHAAAVHVHVVVVETHAVLGVRRVADAGFEASRGSLDDGDRHRGIVGMRRVGVDRRLDACEVARGEEAAHEGVERLTVVSVARLDVGEAFHDLRRVALQAAEVDATDGERRAAVERHRQVRGTLRRVDERLTRGQARGRKGARRERRHRALLGGGPRILEEGFTHRQPPLLVRARDRGLACRRRAGGSVDGDVDLANGRERSGFDAETHRHRRRAAIDGDVDDCREMTLRGSRLGGLRHGVAQQTLEQEFGHVLEILPAHEIDGAADRRGNRPGRHDLDAVVHGRVGMSGRGRIGHAGG